MHPRPFADAAAIDRALAAREFLVFKHSASCGISAQAFEEYAAFAAAHPQVPTAWIDVIAHRPWSRHVAERTGVVHQSPQALLVRDGAVVWHASHGGITREALERAVAGESR